jgi:hypothetical protein
LGICRENRRPDWLTVEDCQHLRGEQARRRQIRSDAPIAKGSGCEQSASC